MSYKLKVRSLVVRTIPVLVSHYPLISTMFIHIWILIRTLSVKDHAWSEQFQFGSLKPSQFRSPKDHNAQWRSPHHMHYSFSGMIRATVDFRSHPSTHILLTLTSKLVNHKPPVFIKGVPNSIARPTSDQITLISKDRPHRLNPYNQLTIRSPLPPLQNEKLWIRLTGPGNWICKM